MRITPAIMLASIVACSSSSKSLEPTEPARSVGTTSASADDSSSETAMTDAERIAAVMARFETMLMAVEPADGNCEALAKRIEVFSETEDAEALRAMMHDDDTDVFMKAHEAELERDYASIRDRFVAVMTPCAGDEDVEKALDRSKIFVKRRVTKLADGTVIEEKVTDEEAEESDED